MGLAIPENRKMMWGEIVIECLERRLREEIIVKAGLVVELRVQEKLVEEIKAELKKEEEKEKWHQ